MAYYSEVRYYSTTLSDLILAVSAFWCASVVQVVSPYALAGFVIIGVAASLGVLRFGVVFPRSQSSVVRGHTFMSWTATVLGIPLIATAFCLHHHMVVYANYCLLGGLAGFVVSFIHPPLEKALSLACSTLAVLGIILISYLNLNTYGIGGGMAYALSSAVKEVNSISGLRGVDLFHYALVVGNVLFMLGLVR